MPTEKMRAAIEKANEMLVRHMNFLHEYEQSLKEQEEEDTYFAEDYGMTLDHYRQMNERPTIFWRYQMEENVEIEKFIVSEFEEILNLLTGEGE